jgi:hypothetical protein
MYLFTDCFSSTECNNDFKTHIKTTSEKLERVGFEQARPDDKFFGKEQVFMTFIVECIFAQIVSILQKVIMNFKPYQNHLEKAGKSGIQTSQAR